MLDDEIGMRVTEVKKILESINVIITNEEKLEFKLEGISDKTKSAYKSKNSNLINKNNNDLINNSKIKKCNIKSYKEYIERLSIAYSKTSEKSIAIIEQMTKSMK